MYMYDTKLGELDVELRVGEDPLDCFIVYGYSLKDFEELSEEDIDYLNEEYRQDLKAQASMLISTGEVETTKLLN